MPRLLPPLPRLFVVLGPLAGLGFVTGCGPAGGAGAESGSEDVERRRAVLASIAEHVVLPTAIEFAARADTMHDRVGAHLEVVEDPEVGPAALGQAQLAWTSAMDQWQRLEVMQIGPAAPVGSSPGGEGLRDEIYSWPTVSSCAVDRALVAEDYLQDDFFDTSLVYAFGLDALEYLLFAHAPGHTCPSQIQLDGPWMALEFTEIERRRAAYADAVAGELARQGHVLADRWNAGEGDFAAQLSHPGEGDSPYGSVDEALDDVFRAMFYVDLFSKDAKLGRPLGLTEGCDAPPCADLVESGWAGHGAPALVANLAGLKEMIQGGPEPSMADGFDDLLTDAGHAEVAATLLGDIDTAIESATAIEGPLHALIVSDPGRVEALHAEIKTVTDTLKGPFVMILRLKVPSEGAGDND